MNPDPSSIFRFLFMYIIKVSLPDKTEFIQRLIKNLTFKPQVHIVQSTGRITYVQLFSMLFSLFTLTVNASRAFFIQRGKDEADPAPNLHMILKVFPYMMLQVRKLNSGELK